LNTFKTFKNSIEIFFFSTYPEYINCHIVNIPAKYDLSSYTYGFQKDSPFLDIFNYYISELKEKGSYREIEETYKSAPQVCPDYSGKPLGFDSCITLFLVIVAGIGISFGLMFFECFLNYFKPDLTWFNTFPSSEQTLLQSELLNLKIKNKHLQHQIDNCSSCCITPKVAKVVQ
jgi:hypothetical protein